MENLNKPIVIYSIIGIAAAAIIYKFSSGITDVFADSAADIEEDKKAEKGRVYLRSVLSVNFIPDVVWKFLKNTNDPSRVDRVADDGRQYVKSAQLADLIDDLQDAFGINADETKITSLLKSVQNQMRISILADQYGKIVKQDLYSQINNSFSDQEIITLSEDLNKKPIAV